MLQRFGKLGKTQLQKLLLLFTADQKKPDYQFVPYKYGAFSFSLVADLKAMETQRQIAVDNKGIQKVINDDFASQLKDVDKKILVKLFLLYGSKSYTDLIKQTYRKLPYYAIHSTIAKRYLDEAELAKVDAYRPSATRTILFTIGYEGKSVEGFLNSLIQNGVRVLVDVRQNPQSMKYGFSKSQLTTSCAVVGIEYYHFPEVGIVSEDRQQLSTQNDYDVLFEKYRSENLTRTTEAQQRILSLLEEKERIALTCFEANICQCHRKPLAEAITKLEEWNYELRHI